MRGDRVKVTYLAGPNAVTSEIIASRDGGKVHWQNNMREKRLEVEELGRNDNVIRTAHFSLDAVLAMESSWAPVPRQRKKSP